MAARFATVTEEETRQMNEEATPANTKSTCLVNTRTTIHLGTLKRDGARSFVSFLSNSRHFKVT